ncbi:MAG TPA: hypothetical protein VMT18_06745 [Planctomycetota bacterium]|nr:hypothetical protein [Planctomycetota bacterium]
MRSLLRKRALVCACTPILLAGGVLAGGSVRLVGAGGVASYTEIQDAVLAAQDGDLILVGSGQYKAVQVQAKGLAIFATPGASIDVENHLRILDLASDQSVVVHGLSVGDVVKGPSPSLVVQNCAGPVRVQDCDLFGVELWLSDIDCPLQPGVLGANVQGADSVALIGCTVVGGQAEAYVQGMDCEPLDGGAALRAFASRVALHDSFLTGAKGVASKGGGKGGPGLLVEGNSTVDSSGGAVAGGNGGVGSTCMCQNFGGLAGGVPSGVWRSLGTALVKGSIEVSGPPVAPDGNLVELEGAPRSLGAPAFAAPSTRLNTTVEGLPGDRVLPVASSSMGHQLVAVANQIWLGTWPFHQVQPSIATTLPAGGSASVPVFVPPLTSGATHAVLTLQATVSPPNSHLVLSDARMVLALDPGLGEDCNGNGLGDLYEIALGLAPDTNHNLIPDTCPGG